MIGVSTTGSQLVSPSPWCLSVSIVDPACALPLNRGLVNKVYLKFRILDIYCGSQIHSEQWDVTDSLTGTDTLLVVEGTR